MKKLIGMLLVLVSTSLYAERQYTRANLDATGEGLTLTAKSSRSGGNVVLQLSGTWSGTVNVYGSLDDPDNDNLTPLGLTSFIGGAPTTAITGNGLYVAPGAGLSYVVGRVSNLQSGTVTMGIAYGEGEVQQDRNKVNALDYMGATVESVTISATTSWVETQIPGTVTGSGEVIPMLYSPPSAGYFMIEAASGDPAFMGLTVPANTKLLYVRPGYYIKHLDPSGAANPGLIQFFGDGL